MQFATAYTKKKPTITNAGYRYENLYQEEILEDGKLGLVKTGKHDIYATIQADAETVKIENILHAAAMGDLSGLNARQASYGDFTEMPKNLMEAQNMVIRAKQEFYELPLDIRKQFDNSPELYISEMGTDTFNEKMKPFITEAENKKLAEATEAFNTKVAEQAKFEKAVAKAKGDNE